MDTSRFVGMKVEEAWRLIESEGYHPRVIKKNGTTYSYYDDLLEENPSYVNLTVRDGIVTKAEMVF